MNFRVVEQNVVGKYGDAARCEDRIFVNDGFASVIDGVTTKSGLQLRSDNQGVIAGQIIEEVLASLPPFASKEMFVASVNTRFMAFYRENELVAHMEHYPIDRLSASAVVYSNYLREIWMIGDCQALVGQRRITNNKLIDFVLANLRSLIIELELDSGGELRDLLIEDKGRSFIYELLKKQPKFQNSKFESDFSYGVLDGFPVHPKHVVTHKVDSTSLVLASDGYPELFGDLTTTERRLAEVLQKDPLCFRENKSTKGMLNNQVSYDDRAYLRLELMNTSS